jgi:hypothetical protein
VAVDWERAHLAVGIAGVRAIEQQAEVTWNFRRVAFVMVGSYSRSLRHSGRRDGRHEPREPVRDWTLAHARVES